MHGAFRFIILCGLLALPGVVYGECPGLVWSHTQTSSDEHYIFVQRAPDPQRAKDEAKRIREGWAQVKYTPAEIAEADKDLQEQLVEEARLRAKYPVSGLYVNDGSSKLLWTGEWCGAQFTVASDGEHLVMYEIIVQKMEDVAVAFYASGREVRSYKVSDLLPSGGPRGETSHGFKWAESLSFDEGAGVFTATKFDGEKVGFDIRSGNIIRPETPPADTRPKSVEGDNTPAPQQKSVFLAVAIATCLLIGVVYWLKLA
ncbi:MAG TPA: hypothetical protein VGB98_15220 [Pyrinomonadaceae bacterium]